MAMQSPISNVALLINISIEGPEIGAVEFEEIQDMFKNIIIEYYFVYVVQLGSCCCKLMC